MSDKVMCYGVHCVTGEQAVFNLALLVLDKMEAEE